MSLVDEFYKRYDELASKYEKYTEVFKNQGAERPAEVAKYISFRVYGLLFRKYQKEI